MLLITLKFGKSKTVDYEWSGVKLDPVLKSRWCEALRSGAYRQAKESLYGGWVEDPQGEHVYIVNGHCCLGVFCAIQDADWKSYFEGPQGEFRSGDGDPFQTEDCGKYNSGLKERDRRILASLNDGGWTFPEIAEVIETYL